MRTCVDSRCSYGQHHQVPDHKWQDDLTLGEDGRYTSTPEERAEDKRLLKLQADDPATPDLLTDLYGTTVTER